MSVLDQLVNLDPVALGVIVVRTTVVYLALLGLLRLAGKRELGQMTSFDLVVILIISNAVQNAMVGPDTSLTGGLLAAATLIGLNRLVDTLGLRFPALRKSLAGSPSLLVYEGEFLPDHLKHEGLTPDEVWQALREHGVDSLASVKSAVLEVDGTISIIPADAKSSRTRRRLRGRSKPAG